MSYILNTTAFSEWSPSFPQWAKTTTMPNLVLPSTPDMTPYAVFYFLSGAIFFLGSAWMILSTAPRTSVRDGIGSLSDFTKNSKQNRELIGLLESNGMDAEEFLNIFAGTHKRRRVSQST